MGQETVEVSTFRSADGDTSEKDEHGRVLRDNVYGTQEGDALRRDFTVNALYYDPATEEVVDFHGGLADLKKRVLRVIGDPQTRYREDPVRMLRAVRLAAKLGLTLDPATREPIRELAPLMERVPRRLFDEMLKLLLSGHASACLRQLREVGLHKGLLPLLDVILEQPLGERFVTLALAQTDERVLAGRPVSPAFLFAALLWHEVLAAWKARQGRGERAIPALENAMDEVLDTQCAKLAITRASPPRCARSGRCSRASRAARATAPTACSRRRAFAWRTTSSRCARRAAKCRRAGSVVARLPGRRRRRARRCCSRERAEEAQAPPPQKRPVPAAASAPETA